MVNSVSLIKSLARASAQSTPAHEELIAQIQKLKSLAEKQNSKHVIHTELHKLEGQLRQVAKNQGRMLRKETDDMAALRVQLDEMKTGSGVELAQRLDRVMFLLSELNARVDTHASIREEQKKRMDELDQKITDNLEKNFKEIVQLEKSIAALDSKHADLKASEQFDQKHLKHIESRIRRLRGDLFEKKVELAEKRKDALIREALPLNPRTELEAPPRRSAIGFDSHKMLFLPVSSESDEYPPFPVHREQDSAHPELLEDMPHEEPSSILQSDFAPPPAKKKTIGAFIRHLFGRD